MLVSPLQPSNAELPIDEILLGITRVVNPVQLVNMLSPILVGLLPIVNDVIDELVNWELFNVAFEA